MNTLYKTLKCGKEMSGYGEADLNANITNHEQNCPVCNSTNPRVVQELIDNTIIESVTTDNKKIVKDKVKGKRTGGLKKIFKGNKNE